MTIRVSQSVPQSAVNSNMIQNNNNSVSFKSNPVDSVELTSKKSGNNGVYKGVAAAFFATAIAAGADLVFAKGKHIKKIVNKLTGEADDIVKNKELQKKLSEVQKSADDLKNAKEEANKKIKELEEKLNKKNRSETVYYSNSYREAKPIKTKKTRKKTTNTEVSKPETQKVEVSKPETQKAEVSKPETQKAEVSKPETQKAEVSKPETQKVEVSKPETQKAEVSKPETQKAEVSKPETQKVEVSKPETQKAEVSKPETQKAEVSKPETQKAEVSKPETQKAEVVDDSIEKNAQELSLLVNGVKDDTNNKILGILEGLKRNKSQQNMQTEVQQRAEGLKQLEIEESIQRSRKKRSDRRNETWVKNQHKKAEKEYSDWWNRQRTEDLNNANNEIAVNIALGKKIVKLENDSSNLIQEINKANEKLEEAKSYNPIKKLWHIWVEKPKLRKAKKELIEQYRPVSKKLKSSKIEQASRLDEFSNALEKRYKILQEEPRYSTPYRERTAIDGMLTANQATNRQYKVDKFVKSNNLPTVEDVLEDIANSTPYRERTAIDGMWTANQATNRQYRVDKKLVKSNNLPTVEDVLEDIANSTPYRERTAIDGMLTANQATNRQYRVDKKLVKSNNLPNVEVVLEDIANSTPYRERTVIDGMLSEKNNLKEKINGIVRKSLPKAESVKLSEHPDPESIKHMNGKVLKRSTNNADYYEIYENGIKLANKSSFIPKIGKYEGVEFTRTIDNSNEGIRISELRSDKYKGSLATFTEKKFAPEIEAKIRMKDFDNISYLNKKYPLNSEEEFTRYELGNDLVLVRSKSLSRLCKDGQLIRVHFITSDGMSSISNNKQTIWYKDGKYARFFVNN